jgi:hypothetical protein
VFFAGSMIALIGARYQSVTVAGREARLAPLLARLNGLAVKATARAQYTLRREGPIPLAIFPWPHPDIALDKLVDSRLRWQSDAPVAWGMRVPAELLAKLPQASPSGAEEAERDPNRVVHFSQAGKLYRVGRPADRNHLRERRNARFQHHPPRVVCIDPCNKRLI